MTMVGVQKGSICPILVAEGELEGTVDIAEQFKMRAMFSDGTMVHFCRVDERYKVFVMVRGNLLDGMSVGEYSDELMFRKGLRWMFASSKFYEILCNDEKQVRKLRSKLITSDKFRRDRVGQHAN